MFKRTHLTVMAAVVLLNVSGLALGARADEVSDGQALYEGKCGGCHSLDANRVGPRHRGGVGRRVARIPDVDYSPSNRKLGRVWTPARLDQWLQGPQAMAPGAKMFFSVPDPTQRRDIIAYLASVS